MDVFDVSSLYLHRLDEGHVKRRGVDEPPLKVLAERNGHMVAKRPGYARNDSGVRGLRDDHYHRATVFVFKVMREDEGMIEVNQLISYPAFTVPDRPGQ